VVRSQNNQKSWKRTTPKRVQICSKYNATIAFSEQKDKDGTNKQTN